MLDHLCVQRPTPILRELTDPFSASRPFFCLSGHDRVRRSAHTFCPFEILQSIRTYLPCHPHAESRRLKVLQDNLHLAYFAPGGHGGSTACNSAMLASKVLTLLNSSSQTERPPGTHVVVSHLETEDRQINATRVLCQVRQEMMAFLSELARLRSVV